MNSITISGSGNAVVANGKNNNVIVNGKDYSKIEEWLKECQELLKWYGDEMIYTWRGKMTDNGNPCDISDDCGQKARQLLTTQGVI